MKCNKCIVSMTEVRTPDGKSCVGGEMDDLAYETWTILECSLCGRHCLEYYTAVVLNPPPSNKGMVVTPSNQDVHDFLLDVFNKYERKSQ